jgi:peptidoglycan/xylan/chitin deacetylase (PgdA/CDA1 family)
MAARPLKHLVFRAGLTALRRTGAARAAAPWTRGLGAILMLHHVRPYLPRDFEPNRILEVTPDHLDAALGLARARGFDIIPLGEVPARLRDLRGRFIALTFDDGYRDNLVHALPVLEKHGAPFTIFVTSGFADRTAAMWWSDLEEALDGVDEVPFAGRAYRLDGPARKSAAFAAIMGRIRRMRWPDAIAALEAMADAAGVDRAERVDRLCLDWREIRALDGLDLCAIGAHTLTHPILALLDAGAAARETAMSKARIEEMLGRPVHHFAYPVGDADAAGPREFAIAREAGFATALTTRPGMLFPEHAGHLHALPRLSVNGLYQDIRDLDTLLTGAPFALFNRGRRLNVA